MTFDRTISMGVHNGGGGESLYVLQLAFVFAAPVGHFYWEKFHQSQPGWMDSERCNIEIAGNKNPTVYLFYIMMAFKTRIVKGPILGTDVFAPGPSSAAAAAVAP